MAAKKAPPPAPDAFALARAAGLDKAAKQFPDDVIAASHAAASARNSMPAQNDVAAEPWPPMRMRKAS